MNYIVVGLAGIIGALLRYYLGEAVHSWWSYPFPLATLLTNYIGCLVLGWFTTRISNISLFPAWLRLGFGTGLIGSFTTFSTFSVETVDLMHQGLWGIALLYILLSLWGGLLLAWSGYKLADRQVKKRAGSVRKT